MAYAVGRRRKNLPYERGVRPEKYRLPRDDELPLGFKQRLALACSLMHDRTFCFSTNRRPALIPSPAVILATYQQYGRERRHGDGHHPFMDEAEYCDRIGLVYRGKLMPAAHRTI